MVCVVCVTLAVGGKVKEVMIDQDGKMCCCGDFTVRELMSQVKKVLRAQIPELAPLLHNFGVQQPSQG